LAFDSDMTNDYYDEPTEYGGVGGDNRRGVPGPPLRGSTRQQAQDMRREAFRTMNDFPQPGREQVRDPR
jgi:hypothetical protein